MKKWLWLLLLLAPALAYPQTYPNSFQAFCEQGGQQAQVQGLLSTNYLQGSYPGCDVTVYIHGTFTIATIYKDSSGTPLGNPFTSTTPNGSFQFNAAVGAYDVTTSGAGITTPYTYSNVIFPLNPVGVFVPITGNTTMTGPLISPAFNGEFNVLEYGTGSDLGAHITAADAALGSNCGTLEVPPNQVGLTVSTAPTISSCHTLWVRSPVTWGAGTGPVLASHSAIRGDGPGALQTVPANVFITAQNVNHIQIDNLWITNPNPNATNNGNVFFHCQACSELTFTHNHLYAEAGIWTDSTATSYSAVNNSNITTNVQISDNYLNGNGEALDLALLFYTQHVTESNNQTFDAQYGTQWWGGDANANGAVGNTRWAQDISIVNSVDTNVTAAEWGSMGQDITVSGTVATGCSDVCLDAEGSLNVSFSGFSIHNSANGALATFFLSQHVNFGPGVVTEDATTLMFRFANTTLLPTSAYDITVHDVSFTCSDPANFCVGLWDPIGGLRVSNNSFTNTFITTSPQPNFSGFSFTGNRFQYTIALPANTSALTVTAMVGLYSTLNEVSRNIFSSQVTQPSGSYAISITNEDADFNDTTIVNGNSTTGFTSDAYFNADSPNAGIKPVFIFHGNMWGANSVITTTGGAQGGFYGDQWNNNNASFGGLTLTALPSIACLGTNSAGTLQAGTCGSSNATAIQSTPVSSATPTSNQVLVYSAGQYVPTNLPATGVTQINGTAGAFTFSGSGVSCTGTTCTFTGAGSGIGSITWALPAWLAASPTTISSSGTQTFSSATGLTSHEVIGTCGTATTVSLCALVAGDIPTLNQNTTGTASNLSGTPALPNGTTGTTQTTGDNTTLLATDAFVIANSGVITWPTTGDLVISSSSSTPTGLAPSTNGDCVVVLGGAFTLGACNSGGVGVTSLNGQTGVVSMTIGTQGNALTGAGGKVNLPTAFLQVDAVNDLGLDNTGTSDVEAKLASYLSSPPSNGVKLVFPCGKYYYASQLTINATSGTKENLYFYGTVPATLYGTSCVQFEGATTGVTGTDIIEYNNTSAGAGQQLGPMFENLQFVDRSGGTMRSGLHIIQANSVIVNHVYGQNFSGLQYTTGTASVNNGSTSVTCAGGCSWSSSYFQPATLFCSGGHCQYIVYSSSTAGTLLSPWQFTTVSSASYSLDYNGVVVLLDPGSAGSGTNFAQYDNGWYDIGGLNDRWVIATGGGTSNAYGVSRFTIVGGRTNCQENQDSGYSLYGPYTDTMTVIGVAENNCTWFSLSESAHQNTWLANHGENAPSGPYAPNTTCSGSPDQACTRGIELNAGSTNTGWGNTIIGNYMYKVGNGVQVDSDNLLRTIISENPFPSGINTNNYLFLTSGAGKTTATVHQWDMWLDPNGFTGTKTAGSCTFTLTGGLTTNVTGC